MRICIISGDRIKKLREARGISQIELADRIGINNSVLSRIGSGKRPVEDTEINAFADFFEVSGDNILGRRTKKLLLRQTCPFMVDQKILSS
ncbi:helix-turn-helix domain-containing protein [Paenibacillus sp. FSL L8-0463]|uniref:helix-turn-helix domain-containing protein n=1 Tax=Paenibacillus sp. FSL L8-0463 TaxID=2954687 RepID=UPI003119A6D4